MAVLSAIRGRSSSPSKSSRSDSTGYPQSDPAAEARLPFAGYDRLGNRQVVDELFNYSQSELEAVESYERCHQNRRPVLDKLRYMREREPLPGYDAFSVEEIVATSSAPLDHPERSGRR